MPRPAERLANELELDHHDLTLAGRAGRRTVIGCSANLRHTLSPERSAITLSSDADATQQWIHALRFTLARDWTWRGLAEDGIAVYRQIKRGNGPKERASWSARSRCRGALASERDDRCRCGRRAAGAAIHRVGVLRRARPEAAGRCGTPGVSFRTRVRYELELTA